MRRTYTLDKEIQSIMDQFHRSISVAVTTYQKELEQVSIDCAQQLLHPNIPRNNKTYEA